MNYLISYLLSMIFELNLHVLPEFGCIHLISSNKWFILYSRWNCGGWNIYSWKLIQSLKFKYVSVSGTTTPLKLPLNTLPTIIRYLKSLFNSGNLYQTGREIRAKSLKERNEYDRFWISLYIVYKLSCIINYDVFLNWKYIKIA